MESIFFVCFFFVCFDIFSFIFVCFELFFNFLRDIGEADINHKFGSVGMWRNLSGVGEGKGYDQNTLYVKN